MQVTGLPATIAAGQTVCITVTGVGGPVTTGYDGTVSNVTVVQSATRPSEWTVCFTVGLGMGSVDLAADGKVKTVRVRAR